MSDTLPTQSTLPLEEALETLVSRGTISGDQRAAILAEVGGHIAPAPPSSPPPATATPARHRRSLSEVLIEVGLYVGGALVIAAAVVLVAQNWGSMSLGVQIASLGVTALVAGGVALVVGHGAAPGSARRRLAGALFVGAAISAAGTTALLIGDTEFTGVAAFAVALCVMVGAHLVAPSIITELGVFVAGFGIVQTTIEAFRPEPISDSYDEISRYDRYAQLAVVVYGVLWALVVARRLAHRELAVFVGMALALMSALPIIGQESSRPVGMVTMALLAALGFWRFLADGYWPWLAAAIASVTALVFWAVGGADRPALAILVAGLVMLGSSALGMLVARRRRAALTAGDAPPPVA